MGGHGGSLRHCAVRSNCAAPSSYMSGTGAPPRPGARAAFPRVLCAAAFRATETGVAGAAALTRRGTPFPTRTAPFFSVARMTCLSVPASPFHLRRPTSAGGLAAAARPPAPDECFSVARYYSLRHTAVSFVSSGIRVVWGLVIVALYGVSAPPTDDKKSTRA